MTIINSVIKGKQPVIDTLNVTPTTSAQQITATGGTDGYSPVNVSAVTSSIDANIVAGNIKKDVQILGVTGSYEGTTPTGTVNITSNGTHNVSSYEYAEVLVPTTAPAYYREFDVSSGKLQPSTTTHVMDFTGVTTLGEYTMANAYKSNTALTGGVDMSDVENFEQYSALNMFSDCTGLNGIVDLSSVKDISGNNCCSGMFMRSGITGVKLDSLYSIRTSNSTIDMFQSCNGITGTLNLGNLITIMGATRMFGYCTGITAVDLSHLVCIYGLQYTFQSCSSLASVDISRLIKISDNYQSLQWFANTALTSLSFPSLAYTTRNLNNMLGGMLSGVTGCTVHFPAEWQTTMSAWSNVQNGFGGTNTTVLFDLPNVTKIDLSFLTEAPTQALFNKAFDNNYPMPNITSVDLSNLEKVSGQEALNGMFYNATWLTINGISFDSLTTVSGKKGCYQMLYGCTGITGTVDLSSLVEISGASGCYQMLYGCTGVTQVKLSSLKNIGSSGLYGFLQNSTGITTVLLPALKTVYNRSVFSTMLNGTSGVAVHLPSNFSITLTASDFGGTGTTISYDLPAVVVLTGADTVEYERNPKYDTATALAWRINGSSVLTATPYYTSGLTDPTVGTTIYSDSACTIAETTVSSIA